MVIQKAKDVVNALKGDDERVITDAINQYYTSVNATKEKSEVEASMNILKNLFGQKGGETTAMLCGALVEAGFSAKNVFEDYLHFFITELENALPFLKACITEISKDEVDDEDLIIESLAAKPEYQSGMKSVELLNEYYLAGISFFSSDRAMFAKAKERIIDVSDYYFFDTFYWIDWLFSVLQDEPVIVIDINTKKGVKGKMSGIVDNFQLQLLLMSIPELNDKMLFTENQAKIIKGQSKDQFIEDSIYGKWDMCNWEYLHSEKSPDKNYNSQHWIWSEGHPRDITTFEGYRVILLDLASYQRILPIQRRFKNLKADILIEEILDESQVEQWLTKFTK